MKTKKILIITLLISILLNFYSVNALVVNEHVSLTEKITLINSSQMAKPKSLLPKLNFGSPMTCRELLGPSMVSLLRGIRIAFQGISGGIAIVVGMYKFMAAIVSSNADALSKAIKDFSRILIILACILLLPTLLRLIGMLAGLDLSCI